MRLYSRIINQSKGACIGGHIALPTPVPGVVLHKSPMWAPFIFQGSHHRTSIYSCHKIWGHPTSLSHSMLSIIETAWSLGLTSRRCATCLYIWSWHWWTVQTIGFKMSQEVITHFQLCSASNTPWWRNISWPFVNRYKEQKRRPTCWVHQKKLRISNTFFLKRACKMWTRKSPNGEIKINLLYCYWKCKHCKGCNGKK